MKKKEIIFLIGIILFIIVLVVLLLNLKDNNSLNREKSNRNREIGNGEFNSIQISDEEILENKKKMLLCLENELGGYITSENSEYIDIQLGEITNKKDKIQYFKGVKTNDNNMYVIYQNTPSEFEVLKDFDLYFSKKYDVYQKYLFSNEVYILIHNSLNDIKFREIEKKCSVSIYKPDKIKKIPDKTINKLNNTKKIVIRSGNNKLGTINNKDVIDNVLDIINSSYQYSYNDINEGYLCDGYSFEIDMYNDKNKKIDTVYVWHDGKRLIPKSIHSGCSYYNITSDKDIREIIERNTSYVFYGYSDYQEECAEALELIYEDKDYNYYLRCIKSDKIIINFNVSNRSMNIKYALNNNYISPNELVLYNDLMIKEKK